MICSLSLLESLIVASAFAYKMSRFPGLQMSRNFDGSGSRVQYYLSMEGRR